jgi:hypothetical protein
MFGTEFIRRLIMRIKYALDIRERFLVFFVIKEDGKQMGMGNTITTIRGGFYAEDFGSFLQSVADEAGVEPEDILIASMTRVK